MIQHPTGGASNLTRIPPLKRLVKVGLGIVFLSAASSLLNARSQAQGGVSVIWLSNGFLMGILLCAPRKQWPTLIALGGLIDFGINLGLKTPLGVSAYFSLCNMIEVIVGSLLMFRAISPCPDLTQPRQLRSFLLYGVLLAAYGGGTKGKAA